jgi:hypothetical protein
VLGDEVFDQQRNIFEPLPEGRNFDRKYFQPVGRAASGKMQAKEERAARKKNLKRFEP